MACVDPDDRAADAAARPIPDIPIPDIPPAGPADDPLGASQPSATDPTSLTAPPELPIAVFRPSPADRVIVAGPCHARTLCLGACPSPTGVAAVFVDPCGSLLAIATAPKAVIGAILDDPAPFARLTELLGASRVYLEAPAPDAKAIGDAVEAALWPMCVKTDVLARIPLGDLGLNLTLRSAR